MINPFKSKKFVYAVTSVVMFLVVAYLPALSAEIGLTLSVGTLKTINDNAPLILVLGFALIGGHSIQDALSLWGGYQPSPVLKDAIKDILDELLGEDKMESIK
jgi:hypothetical protein